MRSIAPSMRHDRVGEANNFVLLSTKTILLFIIFSRRVVYRFLWTAYTGLEKKKDVIFVLDRSQEKKKHCTVSFFFAVVYNSISPSKGRHKKYCSYRRSQRPLRLTRKQVSRTIFFFRISLPLCYFTSLRFVTARDSQKRQLLLHPMSYHFARQSFLFSCLTLFFFYSFGASFFEECRTSFAGVFPEADRKQFKVRSAGVVLFF